MAAGTTQSEVDQLWQDLLAFIRDGHVVPVVGAELLTVKVGDKTLPLYRLVAERLLRTLSPAAAEAAELRDGHELNDAVCLLAQSGKRIKDLYRPVNDALKSVLAEHKDGLMTEPLRQLASITDFDFFVTTTPDDLLARAIDEVRFGGAHQTLEIEHSPKLPTDAHRDLPGKEVVAAKHPAVFYLFGKANANPFYAIHDEDELEFSYVLQANNSPPRVLSELRSRSLLLVGCAFADWLSRFFLRLTNQDRISSDRTKKEFFVGREITSDREFMEFLRCFSQDSLSCPQDVQGFVAELHRRWADLNPAPVEHAPVPGPAPTASSGDFIFVSYSNEDAAAARTLYAGLQEIRANVAWYDKVELQWSDDWEKRILDAIWQCSLFVPLISASTERREEAFVFREWHEAMERSKRIRRRAFICPVFIDPDFSGDVNRYKNLDPAFRSRHLIHAPGGQLSEEHKRVLRGLLHPEKGPKTP